MHIREATDEDIPEIISVLKASLGEEDLPLSKEIWNYKHLQNPFGESPVFVAEEEGRLAGVRAFMRWKWQNRTREYSAYRAVDTATHPDFQGKGVFKKLTLKAVENGTKTGDNFVFNTPNEKSRPGYIKMGWVETGKIQVALKPSFGTFLNFADSIVDYSTNKTVSDKAINMLCREWNEKLKQEEKVFTPKNNTYLSWRYENNPLQKYEVHASSDFYLAGYIKKRENFKELRIAECILSSKDHLKTVKQIFKEWSKKFNVQVISYAPDLLLSYKFSISGKFGPVLTLRELNLSPAEVQVLGSVDNWNYSLGDLELF